MIDMKNIPSVFRCLIIMVGFLYYPGRILAQETGIGVDSTGIDSIHLIDINDQLDAPTVLELDGTQEMPKLLP
jgi:hypothetical protein